MTLIKTGLLTSVSVSVRMLSLLILNKVLAVLIGPSGFVLVGQLQNCMTIVLTISGGALSTGVVKYTAEHQNDAHLQTQFWNAAAKLSVGISLIMGILMLLWCKQLSSSFLGRPEYYYVFVLFAVTVIIHSISSLLIAIINGKKEIGLLATANVFASLLGLAVTTSFTISYGVQGTLAAMVTHQVLAFLVTIYLCRKLDWLSCRSLRSPINTSALTKLLRYASMSLVAAIVAPASHILVRSHLTSEFGSIDAGMWEALWRVSTMTLLFVTSTLSVYFLPRISEIRSKTELRNEIVTSYSIILPIVAVVLVSIFAFRDLIIQLLFTAEFMRLRDLFLWQFLGDFFKIAAWILSYVMLGRAMIRVYIASEIVFATSFYLLAVVMTNNFGLVGVTYAHAINYIIYMPLVYFLVKSKRVF